jgi:acetolactate synthase-1/2/3 large subunit
VHVAHESTAAIAAAYYGAAKGTAGLALGVKGVGAGNMVGGVANAHFERMPVVCVFEAGPAEADVDLVQVADHHQMFGSVAKLHATLKRQTAAQTLADAVAAATHGRPGATVLDFPSDFEDGDCGDLPKHAAEPTPGKPGANELEAAAALIRKAKHPVVVAGADVVREGATAELQNFVEAAGAAVLVSMEARGVFPESDPRWAGVMVGSYGGESLEGKIGERADLFVLVGVDSMMTHAPWPYKTPTVELVQCDTYRTMSNPTTRVNGSLRESLAALDNVHNAGFPIEEIDEVKNDILRYFARPKTAKFAIQDIVQSCFAALPASGQVVSETGAFIRMLEHLWPFEEPGHYLGTSGGRTMGLMIPAALGAKLANPEAPIIGIGADGSTLMRLGELEVFARLNLAMPLVIVNDRALGTMKSRQKSRGMQEYGLNLTPVDYAAVGRACGLDGVVAETPEEFEKALKVAMSSHRTTVIDARIDQQPYWDGFALSIGAIPAGWTPE